MPKRKKYSLKFRKAVIAAFKNGQSQAKIAQNFGLSKA